jgi:hypothetical protein
VAGWYRAGAAAHPPVAGTLGNQSNVCSRPVPEGLDGVMLPTLSLSYEVPSLKPAADRPAYTCGA